MATAKKRKFILITVVVCMFLAAYAQHKFGSKPQICGRLKDKRLDETSGIAASSINKNIYYVHNDSGDTSRFFAITPDGDLQCTFYFNGDPKVPGGVVDCEDIAVGPGPVTDKSYVYVGDIGDNHSLRSYLTIFRIAEPKLPAKDSVLHAAHLFVKYPDGPKDAETLMLDPLEKLLYIVSKRQDSVTVYSTPLLFKDGDTVTMTKRCKLHFGGLPLFRWITAGDISKDGTQILLKSYVKVYYWKRLPNEPVWKAMLKPATELNYEQEKQGEAIGFAPDGKWFYTTSEGVFAPIYVYHLP